jgi:non-heme chloroperoxidase
MRHSWNYSAVTAAIALSLLITTPARSDEGDVVASSDVRLHYWQNQGPGKPAILLIPGWRTSALIWQEQMKRLGQSHRVVTFDSRSQGQSSMAPEGNTPEGRADDIAALIKQLNLNGAIIVGWSQGVQDVAAYVTKYGADEVSGFVLVDAAVSAGAKEVELRPTTSKEILGHLAIYAAHPKEYSEGMLQAIIKSKLPRPEMDALVQQAMKTPTDTGVAMLVLDIFGVDRRPALAKFTKPTLLIAAADLTLSDAREMANAMPAAKVLEIKNAGHAVFVDQAEAFARAVLDFVATAPRQSDKGS